MSRSGGLLELVARGKKDIFFHANPTVSFFHSVYVRAAPFTKEIHITKPRNVPDWGHWVDFDIEHRGDILKNTYLRITLPTWLSSDDAIANKRGLITDLSGNTYGYTNNIGFQMLEKIQLFQDQVLLHETYGEYLDWRLRQSYNTDAVYIVGDEIGSRSESALAIGRSATLDTLRVPIPILGWQHLDDPGLPLTALKSQRYRIRVYIRRLEELIVCSDGRLQPKPWNMPIQIQETKEGPIRTSHTFKRDAMRNLDICLETTCVYVQPDVQTYLRSQSIRIPFLHVQHRAYTLEDPMMTAAAMGGANTMLYNMPIDFIGSMDRLLLGFRTVASTRAGQRTNLRPPTRITSGYGDNNTFIRSLRLNIANIDRIKEGSVDRFRELTSYWKQKRAPFDMENQNPADIYTLTFGGFDSDLPRGTLNLTRAVLPTIYVTLAAIPYDERNISRESECILYGEAWNIYEIWNSKGRLMYES